MTANEYQIAALRTANHGTNLPALINGVLGLTGEAGECADMIKKVYFQGHDFDEEHFAKELGDVAWYLAFCAAEAGYSLEEIFEKNIDKLTARYPDGFRVQNSVKRKEGDV